MIRFRLYVMTGIALLATAAGAQDADQPLARTVDLTAVDRKIVKEPAYRTTQPLYALMVLGQDAKRRMWIVIDGDDLYVDRNSDGDLADASEKVTIVKVIPEKDHFVREYRCFAMGHIPQIEGGRAYDGIRVTLTPYNLAYKPNTPELAAVMTTIRSSPDLHHATVSLVEGTRLGQLAMTFLGTSAQDAPILHFDGPLSLSTIDVYETLRFVPGASIERFLVGIGTPGLGKSSFVYRMYDGIPEDSRPRVQITFPGDERAAAARTEVFRLKEKC